MRSWAQTHRPDIAALCMIGLAALARVPTLAQPLTENFAWRQTQTAWTARIFHEQGIDLLHPEVPVHGPPWVFGFEFPLFQALGSLLMDAGLPADVAMRTLGLITFLATGWLVYVLVARLAGATASLVALGAFLFSPFGLVWGRTSLIEYLATAAALGFLLAAVQWRQDRRPVTYALALALGVTAMLVKITTGAFYLLPLLAVRGRDGRPVALRDWRLVPLIAVPSLAGLGWIAYIDGLKASIPATAFQTSARMIVFNFGTPALRLDPEFLVAVGAAIGVGLMGSGLLIWLPAALAKLRRIADGPFLGALIVSVMVAAPLVLAPLYATQNYYPAAMSPVVAMLVGLGAAWGWEHRRSGVGRFVVLAGPALWIATLGVTLDYWTIGYAGVVDRDGSLPAAAYVRERTESDDWVVVDGRGWDPTILYYADRRGYMLDPRRGAVDDLARLRADDRYTIFVTCPYEDVCRDLAP